MKVENLQELLVDELRDILNAEQQITKALPKMAKKTKNPELRAAFEQHLTETQVQITRLEQVFQHLGERVKSKPCLAMEGIINEGKELMGEDMADDVMDAALIAAAQKVEHYEIASYGTVRTWAKHLKLKEVVALLQETLNEEGMTDKKLTQLATSSINIDAADGDEGNMDEDANAAAAAGVKRRK